MNRMSLFTNKAINFSYKLRYKKNGHDQNWSIPTHMTDQERLWLYRLVIEHKPKRILEIGSYLGASSCFLAAALVENGGKGTLYCVDTWQNHHMSEGLKDTYGDFLRNTEKYSQILVPLRGYSNEVAEEFNHHLDMLFIDGDHSYKGCKLDINSWFPKLKRMD